MRAVNVRRWASLLCAMAALATTQPVPAQNAPGGAGADAEPTPAERPYWRSAREGWFWYEDPVVEAPRRQKNPPVPAKTPLERDLEGFKAFKERVEQSLHAAVQNPNPENVARFLELQAESRRKARSFTDMTRIAAARMPWLSPDADGSRPANPVAADTFDRERVAKRLALMQQLGQSHGLYFFFRSDCPYCHSFAPLLKQFEAKYGVTVFAVSIDGGPLPQFPNAMRDNGTFLRILTDAGIPPEKVQVPFTALASPRTREVLPVGFGVMTADEVAERIELALDAKGRQQAMATR
jgi:conjugal transfer pilus assembly protein TraF